MKPKEKRMIFILVIITIIVAVIFFATRGNKKEDVDNDKQAQNENAVIEEFVQVLDDGTKLNTSTKLNEAKTVEGYTFENIQFTEQNGQSILLADVTNNSGSATDITLVDLILLDKEGNEIVTLGGIIAPLQAGEKTQFNTSSTLDYANAYDFNVVIK